MLTIRNFQIKTYNAHWSKRPEETKKRKECLLELPPAAKNGNIISMIFLFAMLDDKGKRFKKIEDQLKTLHFCNLDFE